MPLKIRQLRNRLGTLIAGEPTHPPQPSAEEVQEAFNQFAGGEVAEWHFPMMNDVRRNTAYETALGAALKKGGTVLEIGSGSGLLAMIAARQGATQVITCEEIPVLARKASEIIKRNGLSDRIKVINKKSSELVVGKDFPERADVLVAEIFDNGLIGERAIASYTHAKQHLLKPGAQLIPCGARVIGMCIESKEIFETQRVSQAAGFDVSPFNEFARKGYKGYYIDRYKYRALTGKQIFFNFDFRQPQIDSSVPLEFEVAESGLCHAVVYWFELQLDAHTVIDTSPDATTRTSWEQAVHILETPLPLVKGERLKLLAHHDAETVWFTHPAI